MPEPLEALVTLFERGGAALGTIFVLSVFMWALILERYWFYARELDALRQELLTQGRQAGTAGLDGLRATLAAAFALRIRYHLQFIRTLAAILPVLGLLGTVSGMIETFDVINVFGSGNVRGMAAGISRALLTTLAGLVAALSGIYFSANLEARADKELEHFENLLHYR